MAVSGFIHQLTSDEFSALTQGKQSGFYAAYNAFARHVYSLSVYLICDESAATYITRRLFEELLSSCREFTAPKQVGVWLEEATKVACQSYVEALADDEKVSGQDNLGSLAKLPSGQRAMVYSHALKNLKQQAQSTSLDDIIKVSPPLGRPNKSIWDKLRWRSGS